MRFSPFLPLLLAAIVALAAGCAQAPPCPVCPEPARPALVGARYEARDFASIPGWGTGAQALALRAFLEGCPRIAAASPLKRTCDAAAAVAPGDDAARRFFEANFTAYAVLSADGGAEGLITGYYEPVLPGSRTRSERFRHPVYGVPEDLVAVELAGLNPELRHLRLRGRMEGRRLVPYWTRAEIEARGGALRAPVLAWVEDPVELFFLHIQGSGQIQLSSGERIRLGYGDQNGHPYRSLGRYLVDQGELKLEQASMQGIKAWAAANPARLREALDSNPSYVFFRESPSAGGPTGTLGAPLTAGHSLAVDPRHIPLGAPLFLATTRPLSSEPLERLMVAQDTGGAIGGAVRGDFFWGSGAEAGQQAGRMRQQGRFWLLWPRGEPPPRPQ